MARIGTSRVEWLTLMLLQATILWISGGAESRLPAAGNLYVFGDSYADTGNHNPEDSYAATGNHYTEDRPWKKPYGMSWPGHPSGRFSNGRVLTDYFASYIGLRSSPLPYRLAKLAINGTHYYNESQHQSSTGQIGCGVNFAFGGSGVFTTFLPTINMPNISGQIAQLRDLIRRGIVRPIHAGAGAGAGAAAAHSGATALLVVAGNDYTIYDLTNPQTETEREFITRVVKEMAQCLKSLYKVGFRRFFVTNIEPFGCFPNVINHDPHTICNVTKNHRSALHNELLSMELNQLKSKLEDATITTLDLQSAFLLALKGGLVGPKLQRQSCCQGINGTRCGDVDKNGRPLYTLCSHPERVLFWDDYHPTTHGWKAVSEILFKH